MAEATGRRRALLATAALADPEPALEAWDRLIAETSLDDLWDPWCGVVLCRVAVALGRVPGVREGRRLAGLRRHVWAANQARRQALDAAVGVVVDSGAQPLGLRAPGLWSLGPDVAGGRRDRGVDLHVGRADVERARAALERLGWVRVPGTGAGRLTTGLALSSGDLRVWLYTGSEPGPGRAPVDFNALRERAVASNAARCPVLARDDLVAWMLTEGATLGGLGSAGWVVDLAGALDGADEVTVPRAARSIVGPTDGSDGRLAERSVAVVRALAVGGDRAAAILSGATVEPAPSVELPHLPWGYLSAGAGSVGDRARLLGAAALDRGPASTARWLAGAARRRIRARTRGRGGDRQIAAPAR